MIQSDVLLQPHRLPHNNQKSLNHSKPREDRPCNEIRRENRSMPTRYHRGRKVKGYNRMDRKNQRCRKAGQNQRNALETLPAFRRTVPAKAHQTVDLATNTNRPISNSGQVRNQPHIPEDQRNREVGRNCKNVPKQGGIEIRPQGTVGIGKRENPVD